MVLDYINLFGVMFVSSSHNTRCFLFLSVNMSALKEEDASTNHKQAALQLSSAVKMDERQIAIATLFSLLLWSLMKNVI